MADNQYGFPTEVLSLPSQGLLYPEDSPLRSGTIDVKYMTAKEEDILTSVNLINQGKVIDKLLESVIADPKIKLNDMLIGDKVEEWTLKGAFIQTADWSDMDYASNDVAQVSLTLQYDYAILQF